MYLYYTSLDMRTKRDGHYIQHNYSSVVSVHFIKYIDIIRLLITNLLKGFMAIDNDIELTLLLQ